MTNCKNSTNFLNLQPECLINTDINLDTNITDLINTDINLNIKMFSLIQISSQEIMMLKLLDKFYENIKNINNFISIINSKLCTTKISIRLIDYFITKYSKKNKTNYKLNDDIFIVYQSYKQQLKKYKKKYFDPFARGIRIPYFVSTYWIITTIGQLNFFKWFISKNIISFISKNKELIEYDMNNNKKKKIEKKQKNIKINKKSAYKINFIPMIKSNENKTDKHILVTF
jgi:hypothetical protein